MKVNSYRLTELQYSSDREGPWRLYLYDNNGFYRTAPWFSRAVRYGDEEITIAEADTLSAHHVLSGLEVRVTDGGDNLVYHAKDGVVLYGETFWEDITNGKGNNGKEDATRSDGRTKAPNDQPRRKQARRGSVRD